MLANTDASHALAQYERSLARILSPYAQKKEQGKVDWSVIGICFSYYVRCAAVFALRAGESVDQFRKRITDSISITRDLFAYNIAIREQEFNYRVQYDCGAQADLMSIDLLLLFIAVAPLNEIKDLFRETDYGRYRGHPKVNNVAGIAMRSIRAFLSENSSWLGQELIALSNATIRRDLPLFLQMPRKHWQALLEALFIKSSIEFEIALTNANKWYARAIARSIKQYGAQKRKLLRIETSINPVFLAVVKLAKVCRLYDFQWDNHYCPAKLITFE